MPGGGCSSTWTTWTEKGGKGAPPMDSQRAVARSGYGFQAGWDSNGGCLNKPMLTFEWECLVENSYIVAAIDFIFSYLIWWVFKKYPIWSNEVKVKNSISGVCYLCNLEQASQLLRAFVFSSYREINAHLTAWFWDTSKVIFVKVFYKLQSCKFGLF